MSTPRPKYYEIFVPGGFPRHTYNPRKTRDLESKINEVKENLCKLVPVTGHTKSGKTVLVRKLIRRDQSIWIDGGTVNDENDFWSTIVEGLQLFPNEEQSSESGSESGVGVSGDLEGNFLVAKAAAGVSGTHSENKKKVLTRSRVGSQKTIALQGLRDSNTPLVIDDFHYLPKEIQGTIVRALKPLIFDGLPVVIIAIPHRRYDAVKVEKEMTGRIYPVEIPPWDEDELVFISEVGFALLNGSLAEGVEKILSSESLGSPHLMQEFCRAICKNKGISNDFGGIEVELSEEELESIFVDVANTIGKPIFEKLARGPRQRSDRIRRKLANGEEVDIYGLVLRALAHIKPSLTTVEYEELRGAIRQVSAPAQDPPQLHEVSRVLKHMSDIAATEDSSAPVIDFDEDEKRLHVTDPYFAFFLRWGNLSE